jgi:hypothetical protein
MWEVQSHSLRVGRKMLQLCGIERGGGVVEAKVYFSGWVDWRKRSHCFSFKLYNRITTNRAQK